MIFETYATATLNGKPVMTEQDFNKFITDLPPTRARLEHFEIRQIYTKLRQQKIKQGDCIEKIQEQYPHLAFDTIRKAIYKVGEK